MICEIKRCNEISKELKDDCSNSRIKIDLGCNKISDCLDAIWIFKSYSDIEIVINMSKDNEILISNDKGIMHKDIVAFINRSINNDIRHIRFTSNAWNAMTSDLIKSRIYNGSIKIYLNFEEQSTTYAIGWKFDNIDTYVGSIDGIMEKSSCKLADKAFCDLESHINNKFMTCNRRNIAFDIFKAIDNVLSINGTVSELYKNNLYKINKEQIADITYKNDFEKMIGANDFEFQSDGANAVIAVLKKYGMAYLADSLGLGKTMTVVRILIKTGYKALIVCPNDIVMNQWVDAVKNSSLSEFDNVSFCIDSYQSLNNKLKENKEYDIIIFDEAHNFRNANTLRHIKAQELCTGNLVLLVGATPVNNGVSDLEYQLMLGLNFNEQYDFGVGILREYFKTLKKSVSSNKNDKDKYKKAQIEAGNSIRKNIISKIMIRRTRNDLIKYYSKDIESGKINFPNVEDPVIVKYNYPENILSETIDILSGSTGELKYAIYNKGDKEGYGISQLNKFRLLKLLDSSPDAFISSILKLMGKIDLEIQSLEYENGTKSIYYNELCSDKIAIIKILSMWSISENSSIRYIKLDKLNEILEGNTGRKTVIFTEFIGTADGIYEYLVEKGYKVIKINGSDKLDKYKYVEDNFSICNNQSDDFDILVSTNILKEGINLNRVSIAVNYDITWNPMIINQRVGRLNRLNSIAQSIRVYNFIPSDQVDDTLSYESNILSKYILASYSVGNDENYLGTEESIESLEEYKNRVVSSISNSLYEDQADFKTVEFRHLGEAYEVAESGYEDTNKINFVTTHKIRNDTGKIVGLFKIDNQLITCKLDTSGLKYLDFNEYLDIVQMYSGEEPVFDIRAYNAINRLNKYINSNIENGICNEALELYAIIKKLQEYTTEQKTYNILDNILYNIRVGIMKESICRVYIDEYKKHLDNVNERIDNQAKYMINNIIPKKFHNKQFEFRNAKAAEVISILCIVDK